MSELSTTGPPRAAGLLARLAECVDELLVLDAGSAGAEELRGLLRGVEVQLARLRCGQLGQLAELDSRNVAGALGLRGLPQLIQADLRCSYNSARELAEAAHRFGPRRALTGEPLPPNFPAVAQALADGRIGTKHAKVIADAIEELPPAIRAEHGGTVETTLVELSAGKDPVAVRMLAQRIAAHLHPDGPAPELAERQQHERRRLQLNRLADSSSELLGVLTPACQAIWETILAPLAAKAPADQSGEDERTQAQRLHDAFEEAGRLLLKSAALPDHAGTATTLVVTMTLTELENRAGAATTHHGGTLSVAEALRLAADGNVLPAVLSDSGGILSYGRSRRLASPGQRRALFARDRGCTFPDCGKPAARSEIHHTTDWAAGGRTDLDSLAIACGYHNNEAPRQGWQTVMIDGVPHWRPPGWLDAERKPVRNYLHHPELLWPRPAGRQPTERERPTGTQQAERPPAEPPPAERPPAERRPAEPVTEPRLAASNGRGR